MRKLSIIILSFIFITFSSCDVLEDTIKIIEQEAANLEVPLTKEEVARGLKSALTVGTDTAVSLLHKNNGFYRDELLKITFPKEAQEILKHKDNPLLKAVGITKMINDAELRLNRAAEEAVKEAKPIFVSAITSMTIQDAFGILNGADNSATYYLKRKTETQLKQSFMPKIDKSLKKPLVNGISADKAWNTLVTAYNKVAKYVPELKTVNANLKDHVTDQAIKGLFAKIAEEEKEIRNNPMDRVNSILKRVFGK